MGSSTEGFELGFWVGAAGSRCNRGPHLFLDEGVGFNTVGLAPMRNIVFSYASTRYPNLLHYRPR